MIEFSLIDITFKGDATSSNKLGMNYSADRALSEGDLQRWSGKHGESHYWWRIGFGQPVLVSGIYLMKQKYSQGINADNSLREGAIKDYVWQYSDDGTSWNEIKKTKITDCPYVEKNFIFDPIRARYFRIYITGWIGKFPSLTKVKFFSETKCKIFHRKPLIIIVNNLESPANRYDVKIAKAIYSSSKVDCIIIHRSELSLSKILSFGVRPIAIILGGGNREWKDRDMSEYKGEFNLIRNGKFPILGICSGHQTIAIAEAGMNVIRHMEKGESGYIKITKFKDDHLFKGLPSEFFVQEGHHDEIKQVPSNYEILASSKTCKAQIIKHRRKLIYGVQFHPHNFTPEYPAGRILLKNFMGLAKKL